MQYQTQVHKSIHFHAMKSKKKKKTYVHMSISINCNIDAYIILDIPSEIDNYHSLFLLETLAIHQKLPLPSSTYKATHVQTGIKYCLRRLHGKINTILSC